MTTTFTIGHKIPNGKEIYQLVIKYQTGSKYTKGALNILNGKEIYQMTRICTKWQGVYQRAKGTKGIPSGNPD
jgi:hypothetical protein